MSCESIGRHPCSLRLVLKRPTDANQFDGIPCPAMWKQQFGFFLVFLPASGRGNVVLCLRETVFPPLQEASLFPCILLSVCMRDFSLLSVPWLVDARIPHVVISHLLRALDHVIAT